MDVKQFIVRPVLSSVISIIIVVLGLIALFSLPIEQYPDIAPPTVRVSTSYYGANAETVQKSVIAPLEESINGVENMTYMTSSATNNGSADITVYFALGTDPDMAAINVQNRVTKAQGDLPTEVTQVGVTTSKRQTSTLQAFGLSSPNGTYDKSFLSNYLQINIRPQILRVAGVGDVSVMGGDYSMRIWMKPEVMAQYSLMPSDITAVLAEQNIESATGTFGENSKETFQYTMKYKGRLMTPEEFGAIVLRTTDDGDILHLRDVARIELGESSYSFDSRLNGSSAVLAMIYQTAGSNATEVNLAIDELIKEVEKSLPKDVVITQMMSVNDFLFASMHEVIKTLFEAIVLVTLVVFIFLQDIRSTIVPFVAIAVALIGTFAFMSAAGFSINLITLFALILVIGTVVDDAIIVVEAVQARFEAGYMSPIQASIDAMKGLTSAIISTSLVFMVVFIPVSFMGGTSGTFYTQFGLTMAAAVGISTLNALTLSPALCALLLKPHLNEHGEQYDNFSARFRRSFNVAFDTLIGKYSGIVLFFIKHKFLPWIALLIAGAGFYYIMSTTASSLVPNEDQGVLFVNVNVAPGSTLSNTNDVLIKLEDRIATIPQVYNVVSVAGYGLISGQGTSYGFMIVKLKDWSEREGKENSVDAVIGQIYALTADIKDAAIFAMSPGMIPGYGMGNSVELHLQDRAGGEFMNFFNVTQSFVGLLNQRPEVTMAYAPFDVRFPQWSVDIDAAKCKRAGVSPATVLSTVSAYYGSQYVSNINLYSKVYRVMIQGEPDSRLDETSLNNVFVRTDSGEMAPLSQFISLEKVYGADALTRLNMYNSIAVNVAPAPGYSSGDVIEAIREVADTDLPFGYGFEFGSITREESQQDSSSTAVIYIFAILMIYLILSGLYESYILPLAVIMSVPFGLLGSFVFAKMYGLDNNIYLQTGLIMLVGLLSKTAILITEFASQRRLAGMSLTAAAMSAAKARLRPVLMTALTMVLGLMPLMVASGVGANGSRSLAAGAVGGMIFGTIAILFVVPTFFIFFQWLQEKFTPNPSSMKYDILIDELDKKSTTK